MATTSARRRKPDQRNDFIATYDNRRLEDNGAKRNSQGRQEAWKGCKLHVPTIDGGIPVSAVLTSASLHDSQAAIPLTQMNEERPDAKGGVRTKFEVFATFC